MLRERLTDEFTDLLRAYLGSDAEKDLYRASELGRQLVARGVGPDTLVAMHHATVQRMMVDQSLALLPALVDKASSLLLEAMMAYSLAYREHQQAEQQRFEQMRLYNEQIERHGASCPRSSTVPLMASSYLTGTSEFA